MTGLGRYETPVFDAGDPIICHTLRLRPSLWAVVFNLLEALGEPGSWRQDDPSAATIEEVIAEVKKATETTIFTECAMVGDVKFIARAVASTELLCDGAQYTATAYPELWAVIDDDLKTGADTFVVPDLMDNFPLGLDLVGITGGEETHTLTVSEIPSHRHTQDQFGSAPSVVLGELAGFEIAPEAGFTGYEGGGIAHNNMPPYFSLRPVIVARYASG